MRLAGGLAVVSPAGSIGGQLGRRAAQGAGDGAGGRRRGRAVRAGQLLRVVQPRCVSGVYFQELGSNQLDLSSVQIFHRTTESQNSRGWKGPLWVI